MDVRAISQSGSNWTAETVTTTAVQTYFKNFGSLVQAEDWPAILDLGLKALAAHPKKEEEAKICAQLTSTLYYKGDYAEALLYANRCHELAASFTEPQLLIHAYYLESAVYRAQAGKLQGAEAQVEYSRAVTTAEEALSLYQEKELNDQNLLGKIYFNLGAAHADNSKGDLEKAASAYAKALDCFTAIDATNDVIRTNIRLGKVYLLLKQYEHTQTILVTVRPQITNQRIGMQADYLEAQLKEATGDLEAALAVSRRGLAIAQALGAKEDELRFNSLLENIERLR